MVEMQRTTLETVENNHSKDQIFDRIFVGYPFFYPYELVHFLNSFVERRCHDCFVNTY